MNWEKGKTDPPIACMPAIIAFLGYDPGPVPETLAERMRHYRRVSGLSIKEASKRLGVDPGTWSEWESGRVVPWPRFRAGLAALIDT